MMKLVIIFVNCLALAMFASPTFAGEKAGQFTRVHAGELFSPGDNLYAQGDTLNLAGLFNCDLALFGAEGGGFVAGNNQFGDLEKAQLFEGTGGGSVSEFLIFAAAKNVGGNGNVLGVIYAADGTNGAPGTVLGTSAPVAMSAIDTSGNLTSFSFPSPVTVGDNFFCSVVLSQTMGDTIGMITTVDSCTAGANTSANAWELFGDGRTWAPFDAASSWGLVVDLAIFAILEGPPNTSVDETSDQIPTSFGLDQNYPNPFNPSTTIQFDLPRQSEVTLSIYNINGQLVRTVLDGKFNAGRHSVLWDGRDERGRQATTGFYVTRMKAGEFVQSTKMLLIK